MKPATNIVIDGSISLTKQFGWGQNLGRRRTPLHFGDNSPDDNPDDIPKRPIKTETQGENCKELNCFNIATEIYVGTAASREAYIENTTNGSCGD